MGPCGHAVYKHRRRNVIHQSNLWDYIEKYPYIVYKPRWDIYYIMRCDMLLSEGVVRYNPPMAICFGTLRWGQRGVAIGYSKNGQKGVGLNQKYGMLALVFRAEHWQAFEEDHETSPSNAVSKLCQTTQNEGWPQKHTISSSEYGVSGN